MNKDKNKAKAITINEIMKDRNCGIFSIKSINYFKNGALLEEVLKSFGLIPNIDQIHLVDYEYALNVMTRILHRDFVMSSKLINKDLASERAKFILEQFCSESSEIYTNMHFNNYNKEIDGDMGFSWGALTNSTFEAGLLFLDREKHFAASIWVEEED
jgi:hypothetical protein